MGVLKSSAVDKWCLVSATAEVLPLTGAAFRSYKAKGKREKAKQSGIEDVTSPHFVVAYCGITNSSLVMACRIPPFLFEIRAVSLCDLCDRFVVSLTVAAPLSDAADTGCCMWVVHR